MYKETEDICTDGLKQTLALLAHHDDAAVRNAIKEIKQIHKKDLNDIYIRGEDYQLSLFTDPRTPDQERVRIAARLKDASTAALNQSTSGSRDVLISTTSPSLRLFVTFGRM